MDDVPQEFLLRMKEIMPPPQWEGYTRSLQPHPFFCIRINSIKASERQIKERLQLGGIDFKETVLPEALLIDNGFKDQLMQLDIYKAGEIYLQNLSSQLIARILDPQAQDEVLDMCAAPGSKTTHLSALMQNKGNILALEKIVGRYHKLKSVIQLLGVKNVTVKCLDAKRFRPGRSFDKILIDAPCSSEGRFSLADPESFAYWSPRKIKEMKSKQKGLLLRGVQLLKTGGTLVYSTCTFAPEENEEVIDWVLGKMAGKIEIVPIHFPSVPVYPVLLNWRKRTFAKEIQNCVRIAPDELWHAFFVAKLRRIL